MPKVLIIDSSPRAAERRNALAKLFREHFSVDTYEYIERYKKYVVNSFSRKSDDNDNNGVILCMFHIGDCDTALIKREDIKAYFTTKTTVIWYGGVSGIDQRLYSCLSKSELRTFGYDKIWQVVSSTSLISEQDSQDLVKYARDKAEGKNPDKPKCLLPPKQFPFLSSLAALSIGYLDAHADPANTDIDDLTKIAVKRKALTEDMAWWKGALGEDLRGEDLIIELTELKGDEGKMKELTAAISTKDFAKLAETGRSLCLYLIKSGRLL
jgi:hypothetical protein